MQRQRQQQKQHQQATGDTRQTPLTAQLPLLGAHNLSKRAFSLDTLMLLNNGLKVVPTPQRLSRQQLVAAIQRFQRSVRLRFHFKDTGSCDKYKLPNPEWMPGLASPVVEAYLSMVESVCIARFDNVEQQQRR